MNKQPEKIKNMFNDVAQSYDKLNDIISFGLHKYIKKSCIKHLNISKDAKILDLCTGTGDMVGYLKKYSKNITGIDFSQNMLNIAQKRFPDVDFKLCDCENLPFEDNTFDIITISYGLRNVENRQAVLKEIYRVQKKGGKFLHLDFGEKNIFGKFFEISTPIFAKIFTNNYKAYKYLIDSKRDFLEPKELIKEIETYSGYKFLSRVDYLCKSISCQIFIK